MDSFLKRSLVGLAYAGIWASTLLFHTPVPYLLFIACIAAIAAHEMLKLFHVGSPLFLLIMCIGTISLVVFNVKMIHVAIFSVVCQTLLAWSLLMRRSLPLQNPIMVYAICLAHLLLPMLLISEISTVEFPLLTTDLTLGVLFFIWGADAIAYSFGTLFGKTPLFRTVSPKKSVEGVVAAVVCSPLIAFINRQIFPDYEISFWLLMGLLITTTSIIGDLVQSRFKRIAGVKDSGTVMWGHGGMYDRLDSLIFSIPFVYLYIFNFQ
jgi:phosphatidate cytidylyltransferase